MPTDPFLFWAPDTLATLTSAVKAFRHSSEPRPMGKALTAALLTAEKSAKQHRLRYTAEELWGDWHLWFSAPQKPHFQRGQPVGNGFYVPRVASAQLSFEPDPSQPDLLRIRNQLTVGVLTLTFSGPARFIDKQNLLAFDFTHFLTRLVNLTVYNGSIPSAVKTGTFSSTPIARLPFFTFFMITPEFVAARGRGSGLALWIRASP